MDSHIKTSSLKPTVQNITKAVFTVNRHAKTATNPKYLYLLKKSALQKLLREGKAVKVGLHFSKNPKLSQQQSDVLIKCGEYTFHLPPCKQDFHSLPHLGELDQSFRNPKTKMALNQAKQLLQEYTGLEEADKRPHSQPKNRPVFKRLGDRFY